MTLDVSSGVAAFNFALDQPRWPDNHLHEQTK
jgi:hypothetical protein